MFPISTCTHSLYRLINCHNVLFGKGWKNINNTFKVQPASAHRLYCTFILLLHHYPHDRSFLCYLWSIFFIALLSILSLELYYYINPMRTYVLL